MNSICIIPARGGSQRIPGKNIREFHGKPIIAYSIEVANRSGLFDFGNVWVSTDSREIASIAKEYGAHYMMRDAELALDFVGTQEVMVDALQTIRKTMKYQLESFPEYACCIYATAPMLTTQDLHRGLKLLKSSRSLDYAFSVGTEPLHDAGMFYWGKTEAFLTGAPLVSERSIMVPISSDRVCDINTEEDFLRAERMYLALRGK